MAALRPGAHQAPDFGPDGPQEDPAGDPFILQRMAVMSDVRANDPFFAGAVTTSSAAAQLWSAKLGQKALTGKVDISGGLTNRRILFAVLGRGGTTCSDGNHNGRRAHPCFRSYMWFFLKGYTGQHSNLLTLPAVLLCAS